MTLWRTVASGCKAKRSKPSVIWSEALADFALRSRDCKSYPVSRIFVSVQASEDLYDQKYVTRSTPAYVETIVEMCCCRDAVAGLRVTENFLNDVIDDRVAPECADPNVDCYLVDDGAIVVYSNNADTTVRYLLLYRSDSNMLFIQQKR